MFKRSKDHLYIRLLGSNCDCQRRLVLLFSDYRQKYGYEQGVKSDAMLSGVTCGGVVGGWGGDYMPMALFIFENIPLSLLAEASLEASCLLHWQISSSDKPARAVWIWSPQPKKEMLMRSVQVPRRVLDFTCPGILFALATVDSSTHYENKMERKKYKSGFWDLYK
jgi:hypothetical protein